MPALASSSADFTAVLFGLSGCLVDFGARTLPVTLQRLCPDAANQNYQHLTPNEALKAALGRDAETGDFTALQLALQDCANEHTETTPGALHVLETLQRQGVPCAWLDELPADASNRLASALPAWLPGIDTRAARPWPAPDACWQSLSALKVNNLEGCVLISGEPRLLQAGLNAGLWTVGLAACGPLCGHAPADWQAMPATERDHLRAQATLALYRLGVHSVIDQLADLGPSLEDLAHRRQKGEKP